MYRIEVQMQGFKPLAMGGIVLETGLTKTVDLSFRSAGSQKRCRWKPVHRS